jgi:hypothetical protein
MTKNNVQFKIVLKVDFLTEGICVLQPNYY